MNHPLLWKRMTVCTRQDLGREHSIQHPVVCYRHSWCLQSLSLCQLLCQKWELHLSSIAVKVNEEYCWDILLSQQMLDAIITSFVTILSLSKTAHLVHLAFNTVQLLECKTLNFFSRELWQVNSTDIEIKRVIQQHEHELQVTRLNKSSQRLVVEVRQCNNTALT